jgi:very-short-patch-repair endonuclease
VLCRRHVPEQTASLDWLLRTGRLVAVLPGTYAPPELAVEPLVQMRAVCTTYPDSVLVGGAAARLTFWDRAPLPRIEAAVPSGLRPRAGFGWQRRRIPPELVAERGGLRFTVPALTALELATLERAEPIDVALRSRMATLAGMHDALRLTCHRVGNAERARLLLDSRDEPWSEAERRAHRLLRAARIHGWKGNLPVVVAGRQYFLDIGFRRQRLALEIDGRIHEDDQDLFESDRWRQNALVRDGWRVLRFTWRMLLDHPDAFVEDVRANLRMSTQWRR